MDSRGAGQQKYLKITLRGYSTSRGHDDQFSLFSQIEVVSMYRLSNYCLRACMYAYMLEEKDSEIVPLLRCFEEYLLVLFPLSVGLYRAEYLQLWAYLFSRDTNFG